MVKKGFAAERTVKLLLSTLVVFASHAKAIIQGAPLDLHFSPGFIGHNFDF